LTSREIAGNVFITATAGSAVGTAHAYFIPDPPAYVEVWAVPPAIPADGKSRTTVWVRVRDGFNNLVEPGITVTFTAARGQFVGGGNSCTANTTLDGLASCILVADTTPGTVIVIAETYNGISGWFDLTFVVPNYIYVPMVRKRSLW
jgi:Bacterial Ig-like domain (group 1)